MTKKLAILSAAFIFLMAASFLVHSTAAQSDYAFKSQIVTGGNIFGSNMTYTATACETSFGITSVNTGSATTTTGVNCVLAGAIVDAIAIRTTTTVTTAASFEVGVSGSLARYCALGTTTITAGQTVVCTAQINGGSSLNSSGLTAIVITFNTTPGAGAMRVIVYSHQATAPTS